MQSNRKDSCKNSLYRTISSDNLSFSPSELPAKPKIDTQSGNSKGRGFESLRGLKDVDGSGRAMKLSRPERILREKGESCAYHVTFKRKIG
ncbi:unnamed protein product [Prunus armeniaca]|uniref:Uncharacterized protein n=1 Tax=Prunus armeniaca TaxID=36596 RepID=A0A6J5UEL2_PRUAR|nr:unnamed protein product [Prunus armeniaca]